MELLPTKSRTQPQAQITIIRGDHNSEPIKPFPVATLKKVPIPSPSKQKTALNNALSRAERPKVRTSPRKRRHDGSLSLKASSSKKTVAHTNAHWSSESEEDSNSDENALGMKVANIPRFCLEKPQVHGGIWLCPGCSYVINVSSLSPRILDGLSFDAAQRLSLQSTWTMCSEVEADFLKMVSNHYENHIHALGISLSRQQVCFCFHSIFFCLTAPL